MVDAGDDADEEGLLKRDKPAEKAEEEEVAFVVAAEESDTALGSDPSSFLLDNTDGCALVLRTTPSSDDAFAKAGLDVLPPFSWALASFMAARRCRVAAIS